VNGSGCRSENARARASVHGDEDERAIFHVRGSHRGNVSARGCEVSRVSAHETLSHDATHLSENGRELLHGSDRGVANLHATLRVSGSENVRELWNGSARGYFHDHVRADAH